MLELRQLEINKLYDNNIWHLVSNVTFLKDV